MKIQLKRSNQLDGGSAKEPSLTYMEYGELAVNFNTADPAIFIKSSDGAGNDKIVRIAGSGAESGGMPDGPTADRPSSPSVGDLYFDTDLNAIVYWNGSAWQQISPSTIMYDGTNDAPPTTYPIGTLWFNTSETEAALYVLYEDTLAAAQGKIWVQVAGGGGGGGDSAEVIVSDGAPVFGNLPEGTLWWDSSDDGGQLYILYIDPDAQKHWVPASPTGDTSALDERYVELNPEGNASQNVSGPLTIGPDGGPAVTTLADNGNAEFAGKIDVGEYTTGDGVTIRNGGSVRIKRNNAVISAALNIQDQNGSNGAWFNDGVLGIGSDTKVDCNTLLFPDGSATFAGGNVNIRASDGRISVGDYNNEVSTALYKGNISLVQTNQSESVFGAFNATNSTTPVIDFKADGSASFAGRVLTNTQLRVEQADGVPNSGIYLSNCATAITVNKDGDDTAVVYDNGSANFAGRFEVKSGNNTFIFNPSVGASTFTRDEAGYGTLGIQQDNNALVYTPRGSADTSFSVATDGKATFTGYVSQEGVDDRDYVAGASSELPAFSFYCRNTVKTRVDVATGIRFRAENDTDIAQAFIGYVRTGSGRQGNLVFGSSPNNATWYKEHFKISQDGAATFAAGSNKYVNISGDTNTALIRTTESTGFNRPIRITAEYIRFDTGVKENTTVSEAARINADGSANFANSVTVNGNSVPANTDSFVRAVLSGTQITMGIRRSESDYGAIKAGDSFIDGSTKPLTLQTVSSIKLSTGTSTGNVTERFRVNADGSAHFKGDVTSDGTIGFNLEPDNPANYTVTTEEYEEQEEVTPYVPAVPATYDEDGNELTAEVPAVEATYQTVTKTRDISTYTGPTLDVKARLENLISRLDSLESDEIADDATSTLLLTTVNTLNSQMAKVNLALTAIRAAASVAGTLEELKSEIVTATADI